MLPFDSEQNNAGPHGIGAGASNSAVSTAGAGAAPAGAGAASAVGVSAAHGRDSGVSPFASRNSSAFNALMGCLARLMLPLPLMGFYTQVVAVIRVLIPTWEARGVRMPYA